MLRTDAYNTTLKSISIGYPRRVPLIPEQAKRAVVATYNEVAHVTTDGVWRLAVPVQTSTFEVDLPAPAGARYTVGEAGSLAPQRLLRHTRHRYWNDTQTAELPHGAVGSRALAHQSYRLAFTPELYTLAAQVISYEEYHPFGTTALWLGQGDIEVSDRRYRYTGKEKDEETGLYYHGARYYAPWLARWTSAGEDHKTKTQQTAAAAANVMVDDKVMADKIGTGVDILAGFISPAPASGGISGGAKPVPALAGGAKLAPELAAAAKLTPQLLADTNALLHWAMANASMAKGQQQSSSSSSSSSSSGSAGDAATPPTKSKGDLLKPSRARARKTPSPTFGATGRKAR